MSKKLKNIIKNMLSVKVQNCCRFKKIKSRYQAIKLAIPTRTLERKIKNGYSYNSQIFKRFKILWPNSGLKTEKIPLSPHRKYLLQNCLSCC